ncbi:hypothetical protein BCR33DRAFT_719432, partial [Rhizoclosmatium globosum]
MTSNPSTHLQRHALNHTGVNGCSATFVRSDTASQHSKAHRRRLGLSDTNSVGYRTSRRDSEPPKHRSIPSVQRTATYPIYDPSLFVSTEPAPQQAFGSTVLTPLESYIAEPFSADLPLFQKPITFPNTDSTSTSNHKL